MEGGEEESHAEEEKTRGQEDRRTGGHVQDDVQVRQAAANRP